LIGPAFQPIRKQRGSAEKKKMKMKQLEEKSFLEFHRLDLCLLTFPVGGEPKNASSNFSKKEIEDEKEVKCFLGFHRLDLCLFTFSVGR